MQAVLTQTSRSPHPEAQSALKIWSHMRFATAMGIDQSLIKAALTLFFFHQYPQYMFVYREAFLEDYLGEAHGGKYWSLPLVFAICALGAVHSPDRTVEEKAPLLAKCAWEIIISDGLSRPQTTTIQALLCLAFHELGQGNSTQGWIFSGDVELARNGTEHCDELMHLRHGISYGTRSRFSSRSKPVVMSGRKYNNRLRH